MIDHLTLHVLEAARARAFYTAALAPLGYSVQMEFEGSVAFGPAGKPILWLAGDPQAKPMHLAFVAASRKEVDAFYAAAMAAGGRDNGKPGLRPQYHPTYYGAFVLDPTGHNIEAVCHKPEG